MISGLAWAATWYRKQPRLLPLRRLSVLKTPLVKSATSTATNELGVPMLLNHS